MTSNYRQDVYNEVKEELKLNENIYAIGFDDKGYFIGLANKSSDLKSILLDRNLRGLAVDNLLDYNLGYDIKNESSVSDIQLTPDSNGLDFAVRQLLLSSNGDVNVLEKEMLFSNRLSHSLAEYLNENNKNCRVELNLTHLEDDANGRLPAFRTSTIRVGSIEILFTGHQMSFLTSVGLVKVHDYKKDIDAQALATLMAIILKDDIGKLYDLICKY